MIIRVGHLYPEYLNIYADRGNIAVLERRAAARGHELRVDPLTVGTPLDPASHDLLYIGGGQDREQGMIAPDLAARAYGIRAAVDDGVAVLAVCGGYQLLGRGYRGRDGSWLAGAGLFPLETVAGETRMIGDVLLECDWAGQTIALGCDTIRNNLTGLFTAQDLSGSVLLRAPKVQANFGFDYEMPVGRFKLALGSSNQYSSRYTTFLAKNYPGDRVYQGSYLRSDASIALRGADDRWEVALIGKNIGDKIIAGACSASSRAGSACARVSRAMAERTCGNEMCEPRNFEFEE